MRERGLEIKVGAMILIALVLLGGFIFILGNFSLSDGYTVYASFRYSGNIHPGAPVKVSGIKVGKVKSVQFRGGRVSAKTGKGQKRLMDAVHHAHKAFTTRVSTGALNRWFEGIVERHPPSLFKGAPVKLYYITQAESSPPTFILSVNYPEGVHFSYQRYLANQLRSEFKLDGTPIRIICRARNRKAQPGR